MAHASEQVAGWTGIWDTADQASGFASGLRPQCAPTDGLIIWLIRAELRKAPPPKLNLFQAFGLDGVLEVTELIHPVFTPEPPKLKLIAWNEGSRQARSLLALNFTTCLQPFDLSRLGFERYDAGAGGDIGQLAGGIEYLLFYQTAENLNECLARFHCKISHFPTHFAAIESTIGAEESSLSIQLLQKTLKLVEAFVPGQSNRNAPWDEFRVRTFGSGFDGTLQ
jgi:hypothetical protein